MLKRVFLCDTAKQLGMHRRTIRRACSAVGAATARGQRAHLGTPARDVLDETGMRRGEILGLTWDRVDLSRGVLRLEITKSGRRREVPMRQQVYDVLAARPEPRVGRVWPDKQIRKAFETAVALAQLDDFRFHDLRHTFASTMLPRNAPLLYVQQHGGSGEREGRAPPGAAGEPPSPAVVLGA